LYSDEQDAVVFDRSMRTDQEHLANYARTVMVAAMLAVASSGAFLNGYGYWVGYASRLYTNEAG
jgi:hypothetical protein